MKKRSSLSFARKRRNRNAHLMKEAGSWFCHLFVAIFLAGILVYFFGMRLSVVGASMEKTLYNGQQILVSRLSYLLWGPEEGDIIVFRPGGNRNTHAYVKRVVAIPGDKVIVRDGKLYVNDRVIDYGYDKIMEPGIAESEILLGTDEYFVLGDNCNNSEDSRSGNIGPVTREVIEGKAWFQLGNTYSFMGFLK